MAQRCPSCGYGPIGPFIDNCPICAEPVRNVRSEGAPRFDSGGSWPVWVWWLIGGATVTVALTGMCCVLGFWQIGAGMRNMQEAAARMEAEREADRQARKIVVAADQLLKEFQEDPAAADQKYAGMYLELTGVVERVGKGRHEAPFIVLHGGDEGAKVKVECFFDYMPAPEEARIRRLKGQTVTVRGEYDGRVSNLQLRECILVKPERPAEAGAKP